MSLRRNRSLLAGLLLVTGLNACGGDGDAATSTVAPNPTTPFTGTLPPEADTAFCEPMRQLANYNAETPAPDLTQDWATLQGEFAAAQAESVPLYGDAIAAAPEEIRPSLEALRDYSDSVFVMVAESTSADDLVARLEENPPPEDVLTATGDVNAYIQDACGFTLTETG